MEVRRCLHHWATRVLCIAVLILQAGSLNWYLMSNCSYTWTAVYGADAIVLALFVLSFLMSSRNIYTEKHARNIRFTDLQHVPLIYISWLVYIVVLDVKLAVIFSMFAKDLQETDFFGPNTLKTTLALTALVFLAFVPTLNDIQHGPRKDLIISLTATVTVDILDDVDILEIIFDVDVSDTFPPGLSDAIIAISCLNFLLPIIPLFILARHKFGLKPLSKLSVVFIKFITVYVVNSPLFAIRLYIWHGLSRGISMFLLKNMMAMGIVTFELFEKLVFQRKSIDETETNQNKLDTDNTNDSISP